jgi:hypothetical protein
MEGREIQANRPARENAFLHSAIHATPEGWLKHIPSGLLAPPPADATGYRGRPHFFLQDTLNLVNFFSKPVAKLNEWGSRLFPGIPAICSSERQLHRLPG